MVDAAMRGDHSEGASTGAGAASESILKGSVAGEARFRLLADAAPTMLWTTGAGSGATFFNRAWLQFTGRALQQELGQGWLTGVRPEDRERCLATYDAAATAGESFAVEYQLRRADGEYRWIHDRGAPVYEEPHVLAGYIGSCQDVTDQMETEASLRRQTARLQALADASQAFTAHHQHPPLLMDTVARRICEAIGEYATISLVSEDGEWLDVLANYHADPAVMALYRELQPQSRLRVGEGITGRVVQAAEPARLQNLDQSTLRHLVSPQHRAFVERFPFHSLMCVPLRAEGRVIGAITVAQGPHGRPYTEDDQAFLSDLADRAALAIANARLYQVAQQVLKTREEFFAVAAHELRTPVTSIRGFTQLELRRWERTEQLDLPRARHAMQTIDRQSRRLAALVSRLFDIARLEQGQLAMEPAETDLVGIVADAVEGMRLATSGHEIHLQAPPTLTAWVDGLRFGQVVTNVVENAVKFSPPDGSVDVSLEALDQDTVRLEVRDRGAGVSPERRQRLFERHAPEEAAALEQSAGITAGLGLGLIISRQIVEQHGGRITAEFPADGGTRIVVTLPRRPA